MNEEIKEGSGDAKLRAALATIEGLLLDRELASPLWDVLSALRGPDSEDQDLKDRTTIHIRRAAFPILAKQGGAAVPTQFVTDYEFDPGYAYWEGHRGNRGEKHFMQHMRWAANALGLKAAKEEVK